MELASTAKARAGLCFLLGLTQILHLSSFVQRNLLELARLLDLAHLLIGNVILTQIKRRQRPAIFWLG